MPNFDTYDNSIMENCIKFVLVRKCLYFQNNIFRLASFITFGYKIKKIRKKKTNYYLGRELAERFELMILNLINSVLINCISLQVSYFLLKLFANKKVFKLLKFTECVLKIEKVFSSLFFLQFIIYIIIIYIFKF